MKYTSGIAGAGPGITVKPCHLYKIAYTRTQQCSGRPLPLPCLIPCSGEGLESVVIKKELPRRVRKPFGAIPCQVCHFVIMASHSLPPGWDVCISPRRCSLAAFEQLSVNCTPRQLEIYPLEPNPWTGWPACISCRSVGCVHSYPNPKNENPGLPC